MEYILAKTKELANDFYMILPNRTLYDMPEQLDDAIEYSEDTLLDDNEWFKVVEFSDKPFCIEFLKSEFVSTDYNQLNPNDYAKIEYIVSYQDDIYYFQKISKGKFLSKKFMSFDDVPRL